MVKHCMEDLTETAIQLMADRGVSLRDIGELVMYLQAEYNDDLTLDECVRHIEAVLSKREIVHAILTGIALDQLADATLLPEPLQSIVWEDESLYGVDEIIPLSIVNVYGTIGLTNYGYLDKEKIGILRDLDDGKNNRCNTFLDDLVAAIAAAAASRIAHQTDCKEKLESQIEE